MVVSEIPDKQSTPSAAPAAAPARANSAFPHSDIFVRRHIGPRPSEAGEMLKLLGMSSLEELVDKAVPAQIRSARELDLPSPRSEFEVLADLKQIASQNQVCRSYIGIVYHD